MMFVSLRSVRDRPVVLQYQLPCSIETARHTKLPVLCFISMHVSEALMVYVRLDGMPSPLLLLLLLLLLYHHHLCCGGLWWERLMARLLWGFYDALATSWLC
jgi:hypothetical protein